MNRPNISIITVALNSEQYIKETIESVISQTYKHKELIIIDGNSTDKTTDIIERYDEHIDYWVSEPDGGIADAMNKGIKRATGDYILFLNSDDYLISDNALSHVSEAISNRYSIYLFRVKFLFEDGRYRYSSKRNLGFLTNFKMGSCHQGQVISRDLINELGGFDSSLRISFDYDLILKMYKKGQKSLSDDKVISVMRQGGISSRRDWVGLKNRYDEEKIIHFKNCDNSLMFLVYKLYWLAYIPYRLLRYRVDNGNQVRS